jgi:AcrR family transcriptional regulator
MFNWIRKPMSAAPASTGRKPAPRAAERRLALRASLIDAAERAIAAGGLSGLNARDLARDVGCAVGAIYNVFPHLDAVVFEVNSRTLALIEKFIARRIRSAAGAPPGQILVGLALAYVDFATANRPRWRALFDHLPETADAMPASYRAEQARVFAAVDQPLSLLRPDLSPDEVVHFSRTIFSAVHGIVSLGLDEKLGSLPVSTLKKQLREFVALLAVAVSSANGAAARPARRPASRR